MATHASILAWRIFLSSMDRGAWWATVHRVTKSWAGLKQLSTHMHKRIQALTLRICEYVTVHGKMYCLLLLLSRFSMSNSVRPHRRQPIRVPCPWDSPGKNTGVGCHFLLQCMKVKSESEVAQSCPTLSYPMDCSLPGSSVHGIFQARVLEWGAIVFSEGTVWMWLN